jgi:hypothetical protein
VRRGKLHSGHSETEQGRRRLLIRAGRRQVAWMKGTQRSPFYRRAHEYRVMGQVSAR